MVKLPNPSRLRITDKIVNKNNEGKYALTFQWSYRASHKDCFNQHCCIFWVWVDAEKHTSERTQYEVEGLEADKTYTLKAQAHSQHWEIPECAERQDSEIITLHVKITKSFKAATTRVPQRRSW